MNARYADGTTPLMIASSFGKLKQVATLLKEGADVNAVIPSTGETALMSAAQFGFADIVAKLVKHGANVNAVRTSDGSTSLLMATFNGHLNVVSTLLKHGADVNAANTTDGYDSLMYAAGAGHQSILKKLVAYGADVHAFHFHGATALMIAACYDRADCAVTLLHAGADPLRVAPGDFDAMTLAQKTGSMNAFNAMQRALTEIEAQRSRRVENAAWREEALKREEERLNAQHAAETEERRIRREKAEAEKRDKEAKEELDRQTKAKLAEEARQANQAKHAGTSNAAFADAEHTSSACKKRGKKLIAREQIRQANEEALKREQEEEARQEERRRNLRIAHDIVHG